MVCLFLYVIFYFSKISHICSKKIRKEVFFMKPEPIDLQNIGKFITMRTKLFVMKKIMKMKQKKKIFAADRLREGRFILLIIIMIMEY